MKNQATPLTNLLALDVGTVRIGVAVARGDVRIARPLTTIAYDEATLSASVAGLVRQEDAGAVVVGWPRGMDGQSTQQTAFVEKLVETLRASLEVPVHLQDEALTSRRAEAELESRRKPYRKEDVDALAATYILEDYLQAQADSAYAAHGGGTT